MIGKIATVEISYVQELPNAKYLLGLFFILLQCFVWIAASILTQYMFEETAVGSPFLMTYIGVALMVIMFPIRYIRDQVWGADENCGNCIDQADSFDEAIAQATAYTDIIDVMSTRSTQHAQSKKRWNHKKHALAALHIAPSMFISDYAYNRALKYTTVASCTVLVSTACVFVLFLSCLLKVERFSYGKLLGVICAVVGTALTTLEDVQDDGDDVVEYSGGNKITKDLLYGDMFSLMAAFGYAAYSVQATVLCPQDEELYSMPLLLGYVGLLCSVPLLPMAIYKMVELDNITWHLMCVLCIKGLLDFVVSDYLLFRAVMLTNATVANVGLGLTIPLAFAADYIIKKQNFSVMQVTGAAAVLAGFVIVNWMSDSSSEKDKEEKEEVFDDKDQTTNESELANTPHKVI